MSDQNNHRPVSPLRQRMIEDMTIRHFGEKTKPAPQRRAEHNLVRAAIIR
jgi:hypothetical protein